MALRGSSSEYTIDADRGLKYAVETAKERGRVFYPAADARGDAGAGRDVHHRPEQQCGRIQYRGQRPGCAGMGGMGTEAQRGRELYPGIQRPWFEMRGGRAGLFDGRRGECGMPPGEWGPVPELVSGKGKHGGAGGRIYAGGDILSKEL